MAAKIQIQNILYQIEFGSQHALGSVDSQFCSISQTNSFRTPSQPYQYQSNLPFQNSQTNTGMNLNQTPGSQQYYQQFYEHPVPSQPAKEVLNSGGSSYDASFSSLLRDNMNFDDSTSSASKFC
jgi:hypothetical protein